MIGENSILEQAKKATKKFEDKNGIAVFAIASPTIELFTASYNASSEMEKSNRKPINIEADNQGYKLYDTSIGYFFSTDRNGIYNINEIDIQWWLASPCSYGKYYNFRIIPDGGYWAIGDVTGSINPGVRPIICIRASELILKNN